MLYDMMTGGKIESVPYIDRYRTFMAQLSSEEIASIKQQLNNLIDGDEIHTAGWMPGNDWTDTPFYPIYSKAARHSYEASAMCFGLMVWEVFMERPERWTSGRFEKNGEEIGSRTYFRISQGISDNAQN
ncbi:hypothetical protein ACR9YC_00315 [Parasphingorhabdus sp. DH2-15]|uniref:hypothetical protein n=1 Tax=Parasphingorhabdus sp. DH2-15 TaxID=3444112 RepID=UPI003F687D14